MISDVLMATSCSRYLWMIFVCRVLWVVLVLVGFLEDLLVLVAQFLLGKVSAPSTTLSRQLQHRDAAYIRHVYVGVNTFSR